MEVVGIKKINDHIVGVEYADESSKQFAVRCIQTRKEAIEKAVEFTKLALKCDNAFDMLDGFRNDFSRHLNYEIEYYLHMLTDGYYRIKEVCPINGFSWFDDE